MGSLSNRLPVRLVALALLVGVVSGCSLIGGGPAQWMGQMHDRAWSTPAPGSVIAPSSPGFVAGTPAAPRVVPIIAGPGYRLSPADVPIAAGETITFQVTTMGMAVHEFKVGPRDAVMADTEGLPEIEGIGMMQTGTLTYTFEGPGPFAFACHEPGHFEAGMYGTISVVR